MTGNVAEGTEELSEEKCWELLARERTGRLAVAIGKHPDIFPVNHVIEKRKIVFRTDPGTKLAAAVLGTGVAYEVDHVDAESGVAWSVVVKGQAREYHTVDDLIHAEDLPLFPWETGGKHRYVAITADEISGRRFHVLEPE
ncbi:MAG: pyridoxamine 5'-phosphate oxidase family protein [Candidatus Microthrix subdominans]|jgi:nitroimidazol reductase NimA-like FMN-containing flavoprotein (pyridoxamine 5'-phosphate oxidase superfamily)|uniref:Pyridoxamine 5'-phosphate oxidase family protein n=1 Tax=Candidatus Neomicrothrix subdominans TaxID=2954438 RepID=A0A936NCK8_9ACTN|nr:pyridoxamine 5'-phosphate oxidase family protein [Candidatus Microthrix sp.]MBK9297189.1 pyridoxamine 5'-phosphate oxidase family protein [Candidatus Microthrix subdominans]MBK6309171.1 pyridoxamine 5'-phosphate oxidase family protein [Candidatus Microthrix sp.]MBK6440222.1 pyridoxamine 5'-phosphate oxidase family protein [Candidatus Microthrix sp.]MBK6970402.1 pyridoxamine 5'-phosphate oxidase family protein [Candidatus Microthrix sp.]MBK7163875.1 pyridoxamine 5'-phosphate oxidase family p